MIVVTLYFILIIAATITTAIFVADGIIEILIHPVTNKENDNG